MSLPTRSRITSPARRGSPRSPALEHHTTRHVAAAALLGATLLGAAATAGCVAAPTVADRPGAVQPFAPAPRLDMRWRVPVGGGVAWETSPREFAAPLYLGRTDEIVSASSNGTVTKSRAATGKVSWSRPLGAAIHATPTEGAGLLFVGTMAGELHALNPGDGQSVWTRQVAGSIETPLAFADGRVFFTDTQDVLYAADAESGEVVWQYQRRAPEFFTMKGGGTPVVHEGVVYCGFADGAFVALTADGGTIIWTADLSGGRREFVDVDLAAIVTPGRIYAASYAGGLYALDPDDGLIIWRNPIESITDVRFDGRQLYVASALNRVAAVAPDDGTDRWGFRLRRDVPVQLAVNGPYAFVSTSEGPLYVLDSATGSPLTNWRPSNGFSTPVVFGGDRGYAYSNGGYLYGFGLAY